jgi:rsbT antagonist protein RsbS
VARVPIIRIGDMLIASVQEDINDREATDLQDELFQLLERTGAMGVILDVSLLQLIDSFLGRMLREVALGARLLGAQTVVVGIQPAVAVTLVELGLELTGVRTALNSDKGLRLLRQLMARTRTGNWSWNERSRKH